MVLNFLVCIFLSGMVDVIVFCVSLFFVYFIVLFVIVLFVRLFGLIGIWFFIGDVRVIV